MSKFIRLMDGTKSNAGGFKLKLNEINIAEMWNPNTLNPVEMGDSIFQLMKNIEMDSQRQYVRL